jgi:hypothetical protein
MSIAGCDHWLDALALGGVLATLGMVLQPDLLLSPTLPAGGDTPSHYATTVYLRDTLLPSGRLSGWAPGNYAGFPILQFYFPLSFLLIILLGTVVPLPIAFKLGTVLGTFALPVSAYALVRLLGFRFPSPVLASGAAAVFLLQCGNSMWGGNLQSTLAGEFAFSLGFALAFLFLGTMWVGVRADRGAVANAVLLAAVGLAHGYTLLFAGLATLVLPALVAHPWRALRYLVTVYLLAFCLLGAWLIPLLANLPYTTAFAPAWFIASWTEVLPKPLWPPAVVAVAWTAWLTWKRLRWGIRFNPAALYLWYGMAISAVGYLLGPWIHVVDVRFIPFGQLLIGLIAALALGEVGSAVRWGPVIAVPAMGALLAWSVTDAPQLTSWIRWNYSGLEQKSLWQPFRDVNQALAGTANDPRVVYEHSTVNNSAGSPRMFETLPLFSGRSTLEGLYLQASPTAPFVFYLQAELSKEQSCPFTHVACTRVDVRHAVRHLKLFNARDIIAVSQELKHALSEHEDVVSVAKFSPYEVFRLTGDEPAFRYVEPLPFEPVLMQSGRWKDLSYQWFRLVDQIDVHVVFPVNVDAHELTRFRSVLPEDLTALPHRPMVLPDAGPVQSRLTQDTIEFETPYVGHPHLIKVSYHPNWHVEGASTIYLASPSFMLVYPEQGRVRLWYGPRSPERVGMVLTVGAIAAACWLVWRSRRERTGVFAASPRLEWLGTLAGRTAAALPIVLLLVASVLRAVEPVPDVMLNEGIQARDRGELDKAEDLFRRALKESPASGVGEQAAYYLAIVQFLRGDMEGTIRLFQEMIRVYPTSPFVPEGYYHIGLAHLKAGRTPDARTVWEKVLREFRESAWATHSRERLAELPAESHVNRKAEGGQTPVPVRTPTR